MTDSDSIRKLFKHMRKKPLRILSYNIHKGFSFSNARFILNLIKRAIRKVHPDLVFLQEVVGHHQLHSKKYRHWPLSSQFEYLADELWPHFAYGKNAVYSAGHHGNAILSKYPILEWENLDISTNTFENRGLLHATISIPQAHFSVNLICAHLSLFEMDRKKQITKLCQRIQHAVPTQAPLIVAGDFNDWREVATSTLREQVHLEEAFSQLHGEHARTFPSWLPLVCLDRIYYRGFTPVSATRLSGTPWRRLSDHAALLTEFNLDNRGYSA